MYCISFWRPEPPLSLKYHRNSWKYHKKLRETKICSSFEFLTSTKILAGGVNYINIFLLKKQKKIGGHPARFRKISNFLSSPIIYAISVRPPYCIVRPGIERTTTSSWLVDYLCLACSVKLPVSEITSFYPLIKTVEIMLWPYHTAHYSWWQHGTPFGSCKRPKHVKTVVWDLRSRHSAPILGVTS
jgi:hypothetical protein